MTRDVLISLGCVGTLAMSVLYVQYSRVSLDVDARRIELLERKLQALEQRAKVTAARMTPDTAALAPSLEAAANELHPTAATAAGDSSAPPSEQAAPLQTRRERRRANVASALRELRESNDPETRARAALQLLETSQEDLTLYAARTLLEIDPKQGLDALERIIAGAKPGSPSMRAAVRAIDLLRKVDDPGADRTLLELTENESPVVRVHAARVLEQRGDSRPVERAVDDLEAQLESPDHRERLEALGLLGFAGQRSSIPEIVPLLRDQNSDIRQRAIAALARFGDPSVVPSIAPLVNDPVPRVRSEANKALKALR